jgi:hypothetical protein
MTSFAFSYLSSYPPSHYPKPSSSTCFVRFSLTQCRVLRSNHCMFISHSHQRFVPGVSPLPPLTLDDRRGNESPRLWLPDKKSNITCFSFRLHTVTSKSALHFSSAFELCFQCAPFPYLALIHSELFHGSTVTSSSAKATAFNLNFAM